MTFNGVRVFTATTFDKRAVLGDLVESWLKAMRQRPGFEVVDVQTLQSSDATHHCYTMVIFFNERIAATVRQKGSVAQQPTGPKGIRT